MAELTEATYLSPSDAAMREQRIGSVMITIAWLLIAFDCIIASFIWIGFRSGSTFWFWWFVVEGGVALFVMGLGKHKRANGARLFGESTARYMRD